MKRLLAALITVVALTGCGSHHQHAITHRVSPGPKAAAGSRCVPDNSFMGCSLPAPQLGAAPQAALPAGRRFVDVSDWQPSVNWPAVKHAGIFAAVIKAGEGVHADPTFANHLGGAKAAGLQTMAYWFVRPVGCAAEAAAIRHVIPAGVPLELDIEVPGTQGYASCLRSLAHGEYTSPGTWPGGSSGGLPLWQAEYGPVLHPFFHPVVAWQFTSSASIPGISGSSDLSVDMGMFPKPPPPLPVCLTHRMTRSACASAKKRIASDQRAAASSHRAYVARGCPTLSHRVDWFSTQLHRHPNVNAASRQRALTASRRAYRQRSCSAFAQRDRFFTAAAARVASAS